MQESNPKEEKIAEMGEGYESTQSGKTWPEKTSDLVRPARNHEGIANGKEKVKDNKE